MAVTRTRNLPKSHSLSFGYSHEGDASRMATSCIPALVLHRAASYRKREVVEGLAWSEMESWRPSRLAVCLWNRRTLDLRLHGVGRRAVTLPRIGTLRVVIDGTALWAAGRVRPFVRLCGHCRKGCGLGRRSNRCELVGPLLAVREGIKKAPSHTAVGGAVDCCARNARRFLPSQEARDQEGRGRC